MLGIWWGYDGDMMVIFMLVGGWALALWKIWLRHLGWWLFPIDGQIKHVPNHQPEIHWIGKKGNICLGHTEILPYIMVKTRRFPVSRFSLNKTNPCINGDLGSNPTSIRNFTRVKKRSSQTTWGYPKRALDGWFQGKSQKSGWQGVALWLRTVPNGRIPLGWPSMDWTWG